MGENLKNGHGVSKMHRDQLFNQISFFYQLNQIIKSKKNVCGK